MSLQKHWELGKCHLPAHPALLLLMPPPRCCLNHLHPLVHTGRISLCPASPLPLSPFPKSLFTTAGLYSSAKCYSSSAGKIPARSEPVRPPSCPPELAAARSGVQLSPGERPRDAGGHPAPTQDGDLQVAAVCVRRAEPSLAGQFSSQPGVPTLPLLLPQLQPKTCGSTVTLLTRGFS